jgi:hypothetical protein
MLPNGVNYYKPRHFYLSLEPGVNAMYTTKSLFKVIAIVAMCLYFTACENYDGTCIKGNCTNGQGVYMHPNGEKYVGTFKDGKANGQGTITFPNGGQWIGELKDGQFNGQGAITYANGEKYVGEFKDHKANGQGTYTYPDGRIKRGIWKNNKIEKLVE